MKNFIVLSLLALGLCSTAFAQDHKTAEKKEAKTEKKAHMAEKKMDKKAAHEAKKETKAPK